MYVDVSCIYDTAEYRYLVEPLSFHKASMRWSQRAKPSELAKI